MISISEKKMCVNNEWFRWDTGRNVTPAQFNAFLREALLPFPGYPGGIGVTSNCFRAGVTTMLGQMGAPAELIKSVGRWSSEAWKVYCRSGRSVRLEDHLLIHELTSQFKGFSCVQVVEADMD